MPEEDWTAARCCDLLQPLVAHIAALRTDANGGPSLQAQSDAAALTRRLDRPMNPPMNRPSKSALAAAVGTLTNRNAITKRPRRTYAHRIRLAATERLEDLSASQSAHLRLAKPPAPGELVIDTAFLRRLHGLTSSLAPGSHADLGSDQTEEQLIGEFIEEIARGKGCGHPSEDLCFYSVEKDLWALHYRIDRPRHKLYKQIYSKASRLIDVTEPKKTSRLAGPMSLVAMCLRRVPDAIAVLEAWVQSEAGESGTSSVLPPASGDQTEVIYKELEDMYSVTDKGSWRQLCIALRAHILHLLADAAQEGLLDMEFAGILIDLCQLMEVSQRDQDTLVERILTRNYRAPKTLDEELFGSEDYTSELAPFMILKMQLVREGPKRQYMVDRILSKLFESRQLPAQWILTKGFGQVWSSTLEALTTGSNATDSIEFAVTCIAQLCRMPGTLRAKNTDDKVAETAQKALFKAVASLVATALLARGELSTSITSGPPSTWMVEESKKIRPVKFVLLSCMAELETFKGAEKHLLEYVLWLALWLGFGTASMANRVEKAWQKGAGTGLTSGTGLRARQYDATLALLGPVAALCGHGTMSPAHTHLAQLCDRLDQLELSGEGLDSLQHARADSAFLLADQTGDLSDLAFAEALNSGLKQDQMPRPGGARLANPATATTAFAGFKWDEGMSEWVRESPRVASSTSRRPTRGQAAAAAITATISADGSTIAFSSAPAPIPAPTPTANVADDGSSSADELGL